MNEPHQKYFPCRDKNDSGARNSRYFLSKLNKSISFFFIIHQIVSLPIHTQGILNPEAITDNFPLILRGHEERLLEHSGGIILEFDGAWDFNDKGLLGSNGLIHYRLGINSGDCVFGTWQLLEKLFYAVFSSGSISVPR